MEISKDQIKEVILNFASKKEVIAVASLNEKGPWISNFYFIMDNKMRIYFITNKNNQYAKNTFKNSKVAFNVFWHSGEDFLNRKSIQGGGVVTEIVDKGISERVMLLFKEKFSEMAEILLEKIAKNGLGDFAVWVIQPEFIKYLDDEKFGIDGAVSLNFEY